jgi:hypothetical protein
MRERERERERAWTTLVKGAGSKTSLAVGLTGRKHKHKLNIYGRFCGPISNKNVAHN